MSVNRRAWFVSLLVGFVPAGHADEVKSSPKTAATQPATPSAAKAPAAAVPEVDDELLEFLGGVDSATGDEDWLDYLSQADIAKAAKARTTEPAAPEVKK